MRKMLIFGVHHKYQLETPINPWFRQHLHELASEHQVRFILEEGAGLPPNSCVEVLAGNLGIPWKNIDLDRHQRDLIGDAANSQIHDTFQDLNLNECREWVWVVRISASVAESGLMVCGLCHVLSLAEKLCWIGFDVEGHVYAPRRDEGSLL